MYICRNCSICVFTKGTHNSAYLMNRSKSLLLCPPIPLHIDPNVLKQVMVLSILTSQCLFLRKGAAKKETFVVTQLATNNKKKKRKKRKNKQKKKKLHIFV